MKIRNKDHRNLIRSLSQRFNYPEKDVVYFFIEFAMGICIADQKEKENGKEYVQKCISIFLDEGAGFKMAEDLFKSWKAGGKAHEQMKT